MVLTNAVGAFATPSCINPDVAHEDVMEKSEWVEEVNRLMLRDWCIDMNDAGLSEEEITRFWIAGDHPPAFVGWFAEKHDLTRYR